MESLWWVGFNEGWFGKNKSTQGVGDIEFWVAFVIENSKLLSNYCVGLEIKKCLRTAPPIPSILGLQEYFSYPRWLTYSFSSPTHKHGNW